MPQSVDYVITKDDAKEIKRKLVRAFAQTAVPKIEIVDGDYQGRGWLQLEHKYDGIPLDESYAKKTLEHIAYIWGRPICLDSKMSEDGSVSWRINPPGWQAGDDAEKSGGSNDTSTFHIMFGHDIPDPLKQSYLCPWYN